MIQYLTGYRIANELRMTKKLKLNKSYLIVEGDSDFRLFDKFVDKQCCEIKIAKDKDNVIYAISELNKAKFHGALGLVDTDFWAIESQVNSLDNLVTTDTHDIETMIMQTNALENILTEYSEKDKLKNFLVCSGLNFRDLLLQAASPIGYLRLLSIRKDLKLNFKDIPYNTFVDVSTLKVNIDNLIRTVIVNSQDKSLASSYIKTSLIELMNGSFDFWHLCCGHDLTELIAIGLSNIFGLPKARYFHSGIIESSLRLAYQYIDFVKTNLYSSIKKWEELNTPYVILLEYSIEQAV